MPLIKDGRLAEDPWTQVADDEAIPAGSDPVVSLERWQTERESLARRNGPLGIRLKSDQSPAAIAGDVERFDLIALEFPKFTDGRSYSHARLLRERYGYRGELRAVGNVLRDQFAFLARCGFDALEVADTKLAEQWQAAVGEISQVYQRAADRGSPIWAQRHPGLAADAPPALAGAWAY